jgi:chromosome partitioning protein
MRIIGLASSKGGVGKTTAAVHLASALVGCGASVLLVDLDPQGAVCHAVGVAEPAAHRTSTIQLGNPDVSPEVLEHPTLESLRILGARPDVDHLQHSYPAGRLRELALSLTQPPDFVIVDLAPSMEPLTLWALNELDSVLLVVQATALAIRTIPTMLANVTHHCDRTTVEGLLINHMGNAGAFGESVAQSIRDTFGEWVFPVEIPFDEELQRAALQGKSSWEMDESPATEAFKMAAAELIERTLLLVQTGASVADTEIESTVAEYVTEPKNAWPFDSAAFGDGDPIDSTAQKHEGDRREPELTRGNLP